jgi:hypothetical protein
MGSMVALQLERLEEMRAAFGDDARRTIGLSAFIRDGRRIYAQLQANVHRERGDPRSATRGGARWLGVVQQLGRFESKVAHQGLEERSQED